MWQPKIVSNMSQSELATTKQALSSIKSCTLTN